MTPREARPPFEAHCVPPRSGDPRALRLLLGLLAGAAALSGGLFLLLGAWPVVGFLGAEVAGVSALLLAHRRWSARAGESIRLSEGRLRVDRDDGRGRREAHEMDAAWARVVLTERPGRASELRLSGRGRSVEVGRFLTGEEKADLARALARALAEHRAPVFDNPQLREG